ncbi:hypothetical protein BJ546DRAFT_507356 [Cryomyces antarcticus]
MDVICSGESAEHRLPRRKRLRAQKLSPRPFHHGLLATRMRKCRRSRRAASAVSHARLCNGTCEDVRGAVGSPVGKTRGRWWMGRSACGQSRMGSGRVSGLRAELPSAHGRVPATPIVEAVTTVMMVMMVRCMAGATEASSFSNRLCPSDSIGGERTRFVQLATCRSQRRLYPSPFPLSRIYNRTGKVANGTTLLAKEQQMSPNSTSNKGYCTPESRLCARLETTEGKGASRVMILFGMP